LIAQLDWKMSSLDSWRIEIQYISTW
jgi:hypothetical protein